MGLVLEKNLNNLNLFWQALNVSEHAGVFTHKSWPNKIWQGDFSLPSRDVAKTLLAHQTFSTVATADHESTGLAIKSHLVVMSLALKEQSEASSTTKQAIENVIKLKNDDNAVVWAQACSLAFGYTIDAEVIQGLLANPNASVLAYMMDGEIAGTAISFKSGDTLGIHQLGTVPNFRKKGVAAVLMEYITAQAEHDDISYVSLQASQAGLHLYEKMGFKALTKITSLVTEK